jgi:hypothetical protein
MYDQMVDRSRPLVIRHQSFRSGLVLIPLAAALGLVGFATLSCPLKDDTAWLLYVAEQWLTGRQLYVDLIEINPPMIVWVLALPAALSTALGIADKLVSVPFFAACMLGSAGWCAKLLRGFGPIGAAPLPLFAAVGTVLLALPGPEFGQREHLLVAAVLPYLCIFARSLDGGRTQSVDETIAGILAACGCALKPQFLLAFALLEGIGRIRGLRLLRRMTISAAITLLVYIAAILAFHPAYFTDAIPLGLALYGASDSSWLHLLSKERGVLLAAAVAFMLWWRYRDKLSDMVLPLTMAVFAAGSILVWLLERKAWFYHLLPASILATLTLIYFVSAMLRLAIGSSTTICVGLYAIVGLSGLALGTFSRWQEQIEISVGSNPTIQRRLEQLIRWERTKTYSTFSELLWLGFPVVNNTGVIWSSRFDSMWALRGEVWRRNIDGVLPRDWPIHSWVVDDFLAGRPDVVVVSEGEGIDYLGVLSSLDTRFQIAWSEYRQISVLDGWVRVFRRHALQPSTIGVRTQDQLGPRRRTRAVHCG